METSCSTFNIFTNTCQPANDAPIPGNQQYRDQLSCNQRSYPYQCLSPHNTAAAAATVAIGSVTQGMQKAF